MATKQEQYQSVCTVQMVEDFLRQTPLECGCSFLWGITTGKICRKQDGERQEEKNLSLLPWHVSTRTDTCCWRLQDVQRHDHPCQFALDNNLYSGVWVYMLVHIRDKCVCVLHFCTYIFFICIAPVLWYSHIIYSALAYVITSIQTTKSHFF